MIRIRMILAAMFLLGAVLAAEPAVRIQQSSEAVSARVVEILEPQRIRHEQGFSYIAGLTAGRAGDKDGGSVCQLMENEKPLGPNRARHALVRSKGKGHYSHWTRGTLYFSTSDNSDPRTNERQYTLVSQQSVIRHRSKVQVSKPSAKYSIQASSRPITNRRVTIRYLDRETPVIPRLIVEGWPDLTSNQGILESILKPNMSDEAKSLAIWQFLVDWRFHHYPAEQGDEVHDPVRFINVYGYGFCDDSARNHAALAQLAGLRARVWGLSGHIVAETFYDGRWHMFDPDHEVFYRMPAGHIASVEELARHPEIITQTKRDPIGSVTTAIARLYTTTKDNSVREKKLPISHRLEPVLHPGDELIFDLRNPTKIHRTTFLDQPLPPSLGNGRLKRTLELDEREDTFEIEWPYVLLDGELNWPPAGKGPQARISLSSDGKEFTEISAERGERGIRVSIESWLKKQKGAVYRLHLRVSRESAGSSLTQIPLELGFQFAPRAMAQVKSGGTRFQVSATSPDGAPMPATWQGLEIVHEWDEAKPKTR